MGAVSSKKSLFLISSAAALAVLMALSPARAQVDVLPVGFSASVLTESTELAEPAGLGSPTAAIS